MYMENEVLHQIIIDVEPFLFIRKEDRSTLQLGITNAIKTKEQGEKT